MQLAKHSVETQLIISRFDGDIGFLKQLIELLDKKTNFLVYRLYGLSKEEIKIIEE